MSFSVTIIVLMLFDNCTVYPIIKLLRFATKIFFYHRHFIFIIFKFCRYFIFLSTSLLSTFPEIYIIILIAYNNARFLTSDVSFVLKYFVKFVSESKAALCTLHIILSNITVVRNYNL